MKKNFNKSLSLWILPVVSGVLGGIIYPCVFFGARLPDLGFLAWVALVPLYLLILNQTPRILILAFVSFLISHFISLYWMAMAMTHFGELGLAESVGILSLVVFILSGYGVLALFLARFLHQRYRWPLYLTLTLCFVCVDYLKTYFPVNGFPWILPAYSQSMGLSYFQWIDITGIHGLGALIYFVNGLLAELFWSFIRHRRDILINRGLVLLLITVISIGGNIARSHYWLSLEKKEGSTRVSLLQGNIEQGIKWDPNLAREHLLLYYDLTELAFIDGAQLAIWPETANPYTLDVSVLNSQEPFTKTPIKLPLLMGAVTQSDTLSESVEIYNSSLLTTKEALVEGLYHKRHLVPFGEYIPMKQWLTFAKSLTQVVGEFSAGPSAQPLVFYFLKMGILICYEDIFPDLARHSTLEGANVLVNQTNDAWYGRSSAMYQHLVFSQFRALENRRYLLRATNTGLTALIGPSGELIDSLEPFIKGRLTVSVTPIHEIFFYTRYGDWLAQGCLILTGLALVGTLFFKRVQK